MPKATQQHTKEHNTHLVLKTIYDQDGISRAEIARYTKLTKTTVSSIVNELIREGLVMETGIGTSEGGKPPVLLSIVDDSRHFIGIDLANSEFRGAVVNLRGEIAYRTKLPIDDSDGDAALAIMYELIDKLLSDGGKSVSGLGIGTPGLINPHKGIVRRAVNLDWVGIPLKQLIEERYNLKCYIANDCQAAALGEYTFAHNSNTTNLVVVKIGRGIGSGIVMNGKLYYGDGYGAGEIGHLVVIENGELCPCGNYGCLETVASTKSVVKRARKIAKSNPNSLLYHFARDPQEISTEVVLRAYNAGDHNIRELIVEAGAYLGRALACHVSVLNVKHIVIAGSMARFGAVLLDSVKQEMQKSSMSTLANETEVEISSLGQDIVIKGAASLLLANELNLV